MSIVDTARYIKESEIIGTPTGPIQRETFTGSDMSGVDRTTNRTLILTSAPITNSELVVLEHKVMQINEDYTLSGKTLQFIVRVVDAMTGFVRYQI